LRKLHFPFDRNVLRAHLTMFHHLAPSVEEELCRRLKGAARQPAPEARVTGLINLGQGVAYAIGSPMLADIRESLAEAFWDVLTPQDRAAWRPHVTIQNKVKTREAQSLLDALRASFRPRPLEVAGLAVFRYLSGPWEPVGAWRFGGGHPMKPPPPLRS
jgi:2'-5' RNA ligase